MDANYPLNLEGSNLPLGPIPFSFETGEQGTLDLPVMPFRFTIVSAVAVNQKAVAGTDSGTILVKKGSTTLATITYSASAAINTAATGAVAANAFEQTDQIRLVTSKTTAGGKGILLLTIRPLPQI